MDANAGRRGVVFCAILAALALAAASSGSGGSSLSTVRGYGIALRLPRGWSGVVYRRRGSLPVLHAASFPLPPVDEDDGALRAIPRMRRRDVLFVMLEGDPRVAGYARHALPIRLRRADFAAPVEGMPLPHAFARIQFETGLRDFDLWIKLGAKPAPASAIRAANSVLATLRVAPR